MHPRFDSQLPRDARKSDRARAEILDSALDFLWSNPFRALNVTVLMERTRLSRPAFYQYFEDVHQLMETLLLDVEEDILQGAAPWFTGTGDVIELLEASVGGLVRAGSRRGPILRAVSDAAPADARLERAWIELLGRFDAAVAGRIAADQELGLIALFDPVPLATALNRMNASYLIDSFGTRPGRRTKPVREAILRIWVSALYGSQWASPAGVVRRKRPCRPDSG